MTLEFQQTQPTMERYGSGGIRFDGGNWSEHDHMDSIGNKAYYNIIYTEYTGIDVFKLQQH